MTEKPMLDKTEFGKYAQALLKSHNVIVIGDGSDPIHFPENSPAELLAHTLFGSSKSTLIIRKLTTQIGVIELSSKRSQTEDCKVVEVIDYTSSIQELMPNNLKH